MLPASFWEATPANHTFPPHYITAPVEARTFQINLEALMAEGCCKLEFEMRVCMYCENPVRKSIQEREREQLLHFRLLRQNFYFSYLYICKGGLVQNTSALLMCRLNFIILQTQKFSCLACAPLFTILRAIMKLITV